jgi:putative phosphoesterase
MVRPHLAALFAGVDRIVHAGDVGGGSVLDALALIAPVEAVYGNVDDPHDPRLVRELTMPVGDRLLHVSHGHELGSPTPARLIARYQADILVFGHTHRPLVSTIEQGGSSILVVNPGAAGARRFNLTPTVAILTVTGSMADARIVDL